MRLVIVAFAFALAFPFVPARLKPCPTGVVFAQQQGRPGMVDPRAPANPNAKGTAAIRGRVTNAETGRPLRHATITVTGEAGISVGAYTDENGLFEQVKLGAGKYQVRASLVGYVGLEFREDPESGGGQQISLAEGETFDKADFRLPRAGVISGRIVDEAGEPLEAVQVQALTLQYVGGVDRLTPVGQTTAKRSNDLGRYRIFGLQPGEYYVVATPGPFSTNAPPSGDMAPGYAVTYYPGSPDVANAQKLAVSASQETQADFTVVPSRVFDLTGVVLDFSGAPIGGGTLLLTPGAQASIGVIAHTTTNQDGTFRFRGVAPGPYLLQLQPMPSMPPPGSGSTSVPSAPALAPSFGSMLVNVAANMPTVTLQARQGRTAIGEIVFDGGQASFDFNVRSVQIMARPADFTRSPMIGMGSQMRINADGTFELRNLWGPCVVNVAVPAGWALKAVRAGSADMTDKPIDFDRDPGRLQVVLTGQVTEISGTVTDEGRPVAGAPVVVFASDSSRWDFQSRYLRLVRADDKGHFSVSALPAAEYRVVALARIKSGTGWQRPDFLEPLARSGARVVLHDGEHTGVDLKVVR